MAPVARKILSLLGGALLAAGITLLPWYALFHWVSDEYSNIYGMTALLWAPAALFFGIVAGALFSYLFWPRRPR
jgi:hypothetical protein